MVNRPHPAPGASGAVADLIARLERATGPDRELDEALADLFGGREDSRAGWWTDRKSVV